MNVQGPKNVHPAWVGISRGSHVRPKIAHQRLLGKKKHVAALQSLRLPPAAQGRSTGCGGAEERNGDVPVGLATVTSPIARIHGKLLGYRLNYQGPLPCKDNFVYSTIGHKSTLQGMGNCPAWMHRKRPKQGAAFVEKAAPTHRVRSSFSKSKQRPRLTGQAQSGHRGPPP